MENKNSYKENKKDDRIFVKKYEKIRSILRQCYIFGLNSRDIEESKRSYDEKLNIIKNIIDENILDYKTIDRVKYYNFRVENYTNIQNFLFDSYLIKSLDVEELKVYFYILQVVNDLEEVSNTELIDSVYDLVVKEDKYYNTKEDLPQFISRTISNMTKLGILECKKENKKNILSIPDDILEDFSEEDILKIMDAVSFYSNLSIIGSPGNYVLDVLADYLRHENGEEISFENSFTFKKNFLSKILDDEVIIEILEAIKEEKTVKFKYKNNKKIEAIPIKIVTEYNLGRQYLIAINTKYKTKTRYRIDKISLCERGKSLKEKNINFDEENNNKILVEIEFYMKKRIDSVCNRLEKENNGNLEKIDDGIYLYTLYVDDPMSLIPWIMSFGALAKVRKSEQHSIDKEIDKRYRELFKKYDIRVEGAEDEGI